MGYIIGGITRKWGNNIVFIHPGCSFGELQSKLGFGVDQKHFFLDGVIIIFLVKKKRIRFEFYKQQWIYTQIAI